MAGIVEFGSFRLDVRRRTLVREGQVVALSPRSLDILCCLAAAEHHQIGKRELMETIWPHTEVDENHLHVLMSNLRKSLGPSGRECLVTVPGHGYRLVVSGSFAAISPSVREQPVLTISPLRNLAADARLEPTCFGFMEDLATDLSRTRWISTVLMESPPPKPRHALAAGASYHLTGSLRRIGQAIRLSLRLVAETSRALLWSDRRDLATGADVSEWDQITATISCAIEVAILDVEQRRLMIDGREGSDVCGLFARAARHFTAATFDDNERAKSLLDRAIRLDPSFSPAHQWLAYTQIQYGNHYGTCPVQQACDLGEPAALKAVDTDRMDAGSYASLGFVAQTRGDVGRGLTLAELALSLNPNEADALRLKGACQIALGRHDEGARTLRFSTRIRPRDAQNWRAFEHMASSAHIRGDYEAAVGLAYEAHRLNQNQTRSHPWLISALAHAGRIDEARQVISNARLTKLPRLFDRPIYLPLYHSDTDHARLLEGVKLAGWHI